MTRALLTVAIAAVAAAVTRQAATAAIITLGVTIGTWALDFAAATRGGIWSAIAAYTPTAVLRTFEQGLARVDTLLVTSAVIAVGLVIASSMARTRHRATARDGLSTIRVVLIVVRHYVRRGQDLARQRRSVGGPPAHSFSEADEMVAAQLPAPLKIEIHLGADDPRLTDLRTEVLDRLERVVPHLTVSYEGSAGTGLLANADPHYGEIWYEAAGKRTMLKSAIEPVVLQTIYDLEGVHATPVADAESYPGYPLKTTGPLAWLALFIVWPAIVLTLFWRARKA